MKLGAHLERWSHALARGVATPIAILVLFACVVGSGALLGWTEPWFRVAGVGGMLVTFVLMSLLQRAQNKDLRAVHLKLDELLHAVRGARGRLIRAEDRTEEEIERLRAEVAELERRQPSAAEQSQSR